MVSFRKSLLIVVPLYLAHVLAYIPASPTNSSNDAIAGGLNITDISKLKMQWFSNGSYSEYVSYQLAGNGTTGVSKGALVHFSEEKANNNTPPTATPWIALVSCDKNATGASMDEDIFTLARDKGAVAALLYSLYSLACVINPEYADPATFDQVFDIFSTQSLTSAHLIEYQFGQLGPQNQSILGYNSQMLNDSYNDIVASVHMGYPISSGYLLAVLQAYNATDNATDTSNNGGASANPNTTSGNNSPNTALAMIILYAITGCVSALFCVVIISGAIRAIRHPERYGPRARSGGEGGVPGQSRARGLTRAILDTFPIVKFGNLSGAVASHDIQGQPRKDVESLPTLGDNVEMERRKPEQLEGSSDNSSGVERTPRLDDGRLTQNQSYVANSGSSDDAPEPVSNEVSSSARASPRRPTNLAEYREENSEAGPSREVQGGASRDDVLPDAIGRETCPICIVDFEEGDDIRLLPCEGKHCFHQKCVDPWLLELSSSCPICRHDFLALENMISGRSDDDHENVEDLPSPHHPPLSGNRFSRYLRFAIGRRTRRGDEPDPTDPYMPTAPVTSMYSGM